MIRVTAGRNRAAARIEAIPTIRRRGDGSVSVRSNGRTFLMSLQKWGQSCGLVRGKPLQSTAQEGNLLVNKRSRVPIKANTELRFSKLRLFSVGRKEEEKRKMKMRWNWSLDAEWRGSKLSATRLIALPTGASCGTGVKED